MELFNQRAFVTKPPDINEIQEKPAKGVRAVVRAADILKSFAGRPEQSLASVASATGLDKGTTRRLLMTLIECGFVAQDPMTQRYGLGRGIRTLASNVIDHFHLRSLAVPILSDIAADLQVTAFLSVYENHSALCLERLHDMKGIEVRWWTIGGSLPINCGGAPKLLLSFQSEAEIEAIVSQPLTAMTEASITDPSIFRERLKQIRAQGWELAVDDVAVGLTSIAVPVLDENGEIICAISIAGLTPQLVADGQPLQLERMQAAAEDLRRRLGLS